MKYYEKDELFIEAINSGHLKVDKNGLVTNTQTGRVVGQKTPFIVLKFGEFSYGIATYKLVWLAFNGPIPEGLRVFRKDPRGGCSLDNLEVSTVAENNKKVGAGKKFESRPGSSNKMSRFTDEEVLNLRRAYNKSPFSIRKRAKELGTSHPILSMALTGKSYSYLPEAVEKVSKAFSGGRRGTSRKDINRVIKPKEIKEKIVKSPKVVIKPPKVKEYKPAATKIKPAKVNPSNFSQEDKEDRLELLKRLGKKMRL